MVIVHDSDKYKYFDNQRRVEIIKYSNGIKKTSFDGGAFYLPKRLYEGESIFGDIVHFIANNKDTISNVASSASSVVDSVGNIGSNTIDVVRKIKELKNKQPITDEAVNKVLNASEVKSSGFFYV